LKKKAPDIGFVVLVIIPAGRTVIKNEIIQTTVMKETIREIKREFNCRTWVAVLLYPCVLFGAIARWILHEGN
jgi:hypothetical protein